MTDMEEIDFSKLDGLAAVVVQDDMTSDVLMVGFMNQEAYTNTLETGLVTFYSRSRNKQWVKGESSGHTLRWSHSERTATETPSLCACKPTVQACVTRVIRVVSFAYAWGMNGLPPNSKPFHHKTSTEEQNDTQTRNPEGKFRKRND